MRYDGVCSQRWRGSEDGFLSTAAAAPSLSYFALYPFLHPPIHPRPAPYSSSSCSAVDLQGSAGAAGAGSSKQGVDGWEGSAVGSPCYKLSSHLLLLLLLHSSCCPAAYLAHLSELCIRDPQALRCQLCSFVLTGEERRCRNLREPLQHEHLQADSKGPPSIEHLKRQTPPLVVCSCNLGITRAKRRNERPVELDRIRHLAPTANSQIYP